MVAIEQLSHAVGVGGADTISIRTLAHEWQRIVSVGRGIKGEEHVQLAKDLAAALGAEIAASRPIVDAGWLPPDRQIGSSGQTVAPKLYLALGI